MDPGGRRVLLITDELSPATNLGRMIQRMRTCFSGGIETIDLSAEGPQGDCQGCLRCADANICVYQGHDAFMELFRDRVMKADILILAGTVTDRYLSARWKRFFDRSFFMGHVPALRGKQIGLLISGPLTQNANLRQILEAYIEMQQAHLAGIATDAPTFSGAIDDQVDALAQRLVACAEHGFIGSSTFLGHSGRILFRDEIWGRLRFPFRADCRTFRRLGGFDFPQRHWRSRLTNALLLFLSSFAPFRRHLQGRMTDEMIRPFRRYLKTR
ncbi:NAD(P)H-dependent oxidoreductase [Desulfosarcina cetonica]|uniref:NAD(P)H-dependent oxidoreductase n=1 Tax=Desulfosarcina cetonica TaxID=90730 RepID=UPI00155DDA5B|nr:NAD(P)H-dependent oxidoreductase [Desulfosarcina cetonica]